ncbi:MAG: hypothetical protein QG559_259 [Campylobacterota bacterium]|nr:hypothetical protein [Campylobacterota bacterium]
MKSRYSPLVLLKKNKMKKSEQSVLQANANLNSASVALELSYEALKNLSQPSGGSIKEMLASRALLSSQRDIIKQNKEWLSFAKNQSEQAKNQLKADMLEYEKFQYLEVQEIKKELYKTKVKESKELDEIAIMRYAGDR